MENPKEKYNIVGELYLNHSLVLGLGLGLVVTLRILY